MVYDFYSFNCRGSLSSRVKGSCGLLKTPELQFDLLKTSQLQQRIRSTNLSMLKTARISGMQKHTLAYKTFPLQFFPEPKIDKSPVFCHLLDNGKNSTDHQIQRTLTRALVAMRTQILVSCRELSYYQSWTF